MKISAIKDIVEAYSLDQLQEAQNALESESPFAIEIDGEDEGEKLTHIIASIWIKNEMNKNGGDFKTALRAYTSKVRNSIN